MAHAEKTIIIIAGPNGAGKTTFARTFLPQSGMRFINADLIAAGLSPFAAESMALRAGRLMLEEIAACTGRNENFAFETTLSGLGWLRHIRHWRRNQWRVELYFLALPHVDMAIDRVAARIRQGGHGIPKPVICRRFVVGLGNVERHYKRAVNAWVHYDNSTHEAVLLASGENT